MSTVNELTALILAKAETIRKLKEDKATKVIYDSFVYISYEFCRQ